jgi:hypothetical protein
VAVAFVASAGATGAQEVDWTLPSRSAPTRATLERLDRFGARRRLAGGSAVLKVREGVFRSAEEPRVARPCSDWRVTSAIPAQR